MQFAKEVTACSGLQKYFFHAIKNVLNAECPEINNPDFKLKF